MNISILNSKDYITGHSINVRRQSYLGLGNCGKGQELDWFADINPTNTLSN